MTVARLQKILAKMVAEGHGRKPVCVDKPSFYSALEPDGVTLLDVDQVIGPERVPWADGDGGTMKNDGTERLQAVVVLVGTLYDPRSKR